MCFTSSSKALYHKCGLFHIEGQALDKALVTWGVKSAPGEPEIDLKQKIKTAGLAGALAYGGTELAFWVISVPLAVLTYHQTTGEWLDLTSLEGKEKVCNEDMIERVSMLLCWIER